MFVRDSYGNYTIELVVVVPDNLNSSEYIDYAKKNCKDISTYKYDWVDWQEIDISKFNTIADMSCRTKDLIEHTTTVSACGTLVDNNTNYNLTSNIQWNSGDCFTYSRIYNTVFEGNGFIVNQTFRGANSMFNTLATNNNNTIQNIIYQTNMTQTTASSYPLLTMSAGGIVKLTNVTVNYVDMGACTSCFVINYASSSTITIWNSTILFAGSHPFEAGISTVSGFNNRLNIYNSAVGSYNLSQNWNTYLAEGYAYNSESYTDIQNSYIYGFAGGTQAIASGIGNFINNTVEIFSTLAVVKSILSALTTFGE